MKTIKSFVLFVGLCLGMWAGQSVAADSAPLPNLPNAQSASSGIAQKALAEDAKCTRCHDESETRPILSLYQTKHGVRADSRTPMCTSCHGSSESHLKNKSTPPDVVFAKSTSGPISPASVQSEACLTCHKSGLRTHWTSSQHQVNDVACASCHTVHAAKDPILNKTSQPEVCFTCHKEQRADTLKISTHPIDAGKIACSDCHNPHGSAGPKLLKKNTVNETCWTCHAEKRGPFLWEHQPVTEDCTNCHTPHGSNIAPLLKDRPPMLCDDCHDGPHNSQAPYGAGMAGTQGTTVTNPALNANNASSSAAGRACLNCHVMIHGTNSPSGALLHR